ncbi:MAG: tetratricopeptide repeat protein [Deltaproteobacteria bacterium]|nr:tetratricopeptide repeat protein [Deltaproteobacteria bacterium]
MNNVSEIKRGVYLKTKKISLGTGSTARDQELNNYYLTDTIDENTVRLRPLDINGEPLDFVEKVEIAEFKRDFTFQPQYYENRKSLKEIKVDRVIAQAQEYYEKKEYFSAEYEYMRALKLDEENLRAKFGVGKVYLSRGEHDKAGEVFEQVSKVEAVFLKENKHIFNELGMELRKLGLFQQAISFYKKALSFVKDDEHLYFNIGRAYYEKGDLKAAAKYLQSALKLNPKLLASKQLLQVIRKELAEELK